MRCSLCNSDETEIWTADGKSYRSCSSCGLVQALPEFFPDRVKEKERYLHHNNTLENKGYVKYLEDFIASAISPFVKRGSRILDFGCGPVPVLTSLLEKKGYDAVPFDPYFYPGKEWKKESFDSVVSVEVFEHLKNPLNAVEEISQVLLNSGILTVRTLLHNGNRSSFGRWWYRQDFTHITFYSEKTFDYIAEISGFEILEIKNGCEIILAKTS